MFIERGPAHAQTCEDQAAMRRYARHPGQGELLLAERRIVAGSIWHADQIAAIIVSPSVIGATECVRVAAVALAYGVAAMHASIQHQVDLAVLVARDDHRLQPDLARYVVPWFWNLALMSHIYPFAIPNLFQFLTKDRGIVVDLAVDAIALNE